MACAGFWRAQVKAFTTTFEDLHGLEQLPGLAVQRLMADGYGFGAEGDWKTAALVRAMKVMAAGLEGGPRSWKITPITSTSGMKTSARTCWRCPSRSPGSSPTGSPSAVDRGKGGPGTAGVRRPTGGSRATVVDMGNRFRMVVNGVESSRRTSRCPGCRWHGRVDPRPDLKTAAAAWIMAGGAHHTGFSQALTAEHLEDFADMAGIEFLLIDDDTRLSAFKKEVHWNEVYYLRPSMG